MFEKEAEQYMSNLDECRTKDLMRDAFKDGAEFGYNKANEWHNVKDGDYPKKKVFILLLGKEHITLKNMANGDLMLMFLMQMMDILKVVEILLSPGKK